MVTLAPLGGTTVRPYVQQIVDDIRGQVDSGQLKPGDQLPSYAKIAEQYGCSEEPVRAAMRILRAIGLTEGRQGLGVFVTERQGGGQS